MISLMYVMDGSIKTMNSTWNGPPGQMVRALGKCFHPDTRIKLRNGIIKQIRTIDLGDILEDGSIVRDASKAKVGTRLRIRVAKGETRATVNE